MIRRIGWVAWVLVAGCGGSAQEGGTGTLGGGGAVTDASSDGSGGSGGTAGTGASGGTAGTAGTGGTAGTAGTGATGGTAGTAGAAGTGATAGTAGTGASGGTAGTAGTGATGGTAGTAGTAGTGGTAGAGGSGGCGWCDFQCCGPTCINTNNDIKNCGGCGKPCAGPNPYCDMGTCKPQPPCAGTACIGTMFCCETKCCNMGELCCKVPGPVGDMMQCAVPGADGTCPKGCTSCVCASPDTPVATPRGERPIAELREGDLVYSVDRGQMKAVRVLATSREPAPDHAVVQLTLATGSVLRISPKHPTADGRLFGQLRGGDLIDGVRVTSAVLVPYRHTHTYDILPQSDTGAYFAAGVLVGSTIPGAPNAVVTSCEPGVAPSSR